jgi:hypothetical protein
MFKTLSKILNARTNMCHHILVVVFDFQFCITSRKSAGNQLYRGKTGQKRTVALPERHQCELREKTWILKMLSFETERDEPGHGESALKTFQTAMVWDDQ